MTRTALALVAIVAAAAVVRADAQTTTAPIRKPAVQQEKKEAAEKPEAGASKLHLQDLPPVVRSTVEAETRNATVKSIGKERENGKTVYELESLVNGRTRDLMIDASGKVYEVEEQLDLDKAPAAVRAAIEAKGQVLELEAVTTNGTSHYEGKARTRAGRRVSFNLGADGKPVKQ
jgi:uncharacterized membrane protein YkoI